MKNAWWKLLGAALLIYALVGGMLIPLKPGIIAVDKNNVQTGETASIKISGYNTHFADADDLVVWLKADEDLAIKATKVEALSNTEIIATIQIPNEMPLSGKEIVPLSLVVDSKVDGLAFKPDEVFLKPGQANNQNQASYTSISSLHFTEGVTFPYRNVLQESIRNTFYHIPLWFAMVIIFTISLIQSIKYLSNRNQLADHLAVGYTEVGVLLGVLGTVTGAVWAKYTWGAYWSWDIKQNVAAIALLIYFAYFVLRGAMNDDQQAARIGAVYNIFAYAAMIPLLFVIPRLTSSLHPGNGGNPGFGGEDLDNTMRMFMYPAVIGWILVGAWMARIRARYLKLKYQIMLGE